MRRGCHPESRCRQQPSLTRAALRPSPIPLGWQAMNEGQVMRGSCTRLAGARTWKLVETSYRYLRFISNRVFIWETSPEAPKPDQIECYPARCSGLLFIIFIYWCCYDNECTQQPTEWGWGVNVCVCVCVGGVWGMIRTCGVQQDEQTNWRSWEIGDGGRCFNTWKRGHPGGGDAPGGRLRGCWLRTSIIDGVSIFNW